MSLSQDPVFSMLKDDFVCGYKDISRAKYAGSSGKHMPDGNAVDTTNGAGPHNIQMFIMTPDGIVLHALPGYWNSQDLAGELKFAEQLNEVWTNPDMTREEKDEAFKNMQIGHISMHSKAMVNRSQWQGFDARYEVEKKYWTTDAIADRSKVGQDGHVEQGGMKTTDRLMHERMAARAFLPYEEFDVAAFSDYGKQKYDKEEDYLDPNTGQIAAGANPSGEPMIGNDPRAHPVETQAKRMAKSTLRQGASRALQYGLRAMLR